MSQEIDLAQRRFAALVPALQRMLAEPLNEAETRFQVLDRILTEALQWPHDQIKPEAAVAPGYVDYTLKGLDGRNLCVIEAKRSGRLTLGTASQKLSTLALNGSVLKPMRDAIVQALAYASHQSVPIACVTDGRLWLFFQTNRRDGGDVMDGKGLLFPSLATISSEFPRFHDLLSVSGMRDRLGLVQLYRAEGIRAAYEEDQLIVSPPDQARMLQRNVLARDASLLFSQFFAGITSESDPDMIRDCFVETSESAKADLELQKIAEKLLNTIETIDTSESKALQDQVEIAIQTMTSEAVILIGNKGSGK